MNRLRSRLLPVISVLPVFVVAVALALVVPLTGPVAAHAAPPTVAVTPSALPVGAPVVAPARLLDDALVLPSGRVVRIGKDGLQPTSVHRVRGGYLVASQRWAAGRLKGYRVDLVKPDGRRRTVLRHTRYDVWRVASDGRTFLGAAELRDRKGRWKPGALLRRIRVGDGHTLGKARRLAAYPDTVLVGTTRVLLSYVPLAGRHQGRPRTEWWSTSTGRVRVLARAASRPRHAPYGVQAASRDARAYSATERGRQVVRDLRTDKRLWRTAPDESVLAFAPGGKKVITHAEPRRPDPEADDYVAGRLTVRNARTGRVLAVYRGLVAGFGPRAQPGGSLTSRVTRWESEDTFLMHAHESLESHEEGFTPLGGTWVRCRVSTARCERVPNPGVLAGTWVTPAS
ncbi:hypothetical protein KG112_03220 [Nocardioides sp. zg-ZUI104]|uniref:hypothetical protein n=1 Tax=Nocardioides faecalis TaxID=2803858 RepID=UPI001BCBE2BE|nr:hypothetical protein [Nocardioides faecalis]MBS4751820.1 hypothetical protein [Nocardioides faecalis]